MIRVGTGLDVHAFAAERALVLGGVSVPCDRGLEGHSDADVLTHAVMDAVLGALALGDIGAWFPDDSPEYKDADSLALLKRILADERLSRWSLSNLDCVVVAQKPKIAPFIPEMRANLADALKLTIDRVSVKATTTERLGFCGREEGIAATATVVMQASSETELIDLTLNLDEADDSYAATKEFVELHSSGTQYTGVIHKFSFSSMAGTYIDFPGHIKETDNGLDAANYSLEKLYRRAATVMRFDKEDGYGGVTAAELRSAIPSGKLETPVLILNVLGEKRFDDIELRSVYLTLDAVKWICDSGIEIIISDIYESLSLDGVFLKFFENNVSTVCFPVNLHKLTTERCLVSIMPLKAPGAVQLPCRVVAETTV